MTAFQAHHTNGIGWRERPGDGPVIVALHGIGSEACGFDRLADQLTGWRVVALEAPGYGPSAPLRQDWPVAADYAKALGAFVDAIGVDQFHLVGHSLGTLIGAAYTLQHPDRVISLVLASCAQGGGVAPGSALPAAHAARITGLDTEGATQFAAARAPRLVYDSEHNTDLVAAVAASMSKVQMPGYGQAVRMLASGDLASDCAHLSVPTAVIVGAQDIVTEPAQSVRAHQAIPQQVRGEIIQVKGAGHAIPLQAPDALAAIIEIHAETVRLQEEFVP